MMIPKVICRMLPAHAVVWAKLLARLKAGSSIEARMAMMAITTKSSIRVNPGRRAERAFMKYFIRPILFGDKHIRVASETV